MQPVNPQNSNNLKRPIEEEGASEQEIKRQRSDQGAVRVYRNFFDDMDVQQLQAHLQELDAEKLKCQQLLLAATAQNGSKGVNDSAEAMDIDEKSTPLASKTEELAKPLFHQVLQLNGARENQNRQIQLKAELSRFAESIETRDEHLSTIIFHLSRLGHLNDLISKIDWYANLGRDYFLEVLFSLYEQSHLSKSKLEKAIGATGLFEIDIKSSLRHPTLIFSMVLWKKLSSIACLNNHRSLTMDFDKIYLIPKSIFSSQRKNEFLEVIEMPPCLRDFAHTILINRELMPGENEAEYLIRQSNKYLNLFRLPPSSFQFQTDLFLQRSLALNGKLEEAYEIGGAIAFDRMSSKLIKSWPEFLGEKWMRIDLYDSTGSLGFVVLSKNDFKERFDRIGLEVTHSNQLPILEGFEFLDYVRLFKGQSIEFLSSEYTPQQFLKLFLLAGYFDQKELLDACEDKLIDFCSKLDINDLISNLPAVFPITSPKLHQKISKVLTDQLEYRTEGFAELTAEQKKIIHSIDCSDETFNFFENVAQYLSPFLKKLTLKRIEEKHLPLLQKFTTLEELEIKEFDYNSKNVLVLLQMPCLRSIVCDLFVNESKDVENLANIKQLKIGKSDTIKKVKYNFNDVSRMNLYLDVFSLFPYLLKLQTTSELNLVDYSDAVLEELVWKSDLASGSLHFLTKLKKLIVDGELTDSYKYDYEEFDSLENQNEWKLASVEELTAKMTGGIFSFPNLKKFKLHSISRAPFDLSSLVKLEEFELTSSDVLSSEIIDSLLKLPKLVAISINADIDGDNELFINQLVRKPHLKSLTCKKLSMTADAYQYAEANNITIKFAD